MDYTFLGLGLFIAALLAGRWINERAMRNLNEKERSDLLAGLSKYRMVSLVGVILIVAAYFVFRGFSSGDTSRAFGVFAAVLVCYMLLGTAFVFIKLKILKISESYINNFLLSTAVQYLGLFIYFGLSRLSE